MRQSELVERIARKLAGQYMVEDGYGEASRKSAEDGDMWRNFKTTAELVIAEVRTADSHT